MDLASNGAEFLPRDMLQSGIKKHARRVAASVILRSPIKKEL